MYLPALLSRHRTLLLAASNVALVLGAGAAAYFFHSHHTYVELILAILVLAAVVSIDAAGFAVIAVPGILITQRLAGGSISGSDVLLTLASISAVLAGVQRRLPPQARLVLRALSIYLVSLLASIIANQNSRGDLEWLHRLVLVGGSILVGCWLVERGQHVLAMRLLCIGLAVFGVASVITCFAHGLQPAYPFGEQKNFAGSVLAMGLLVTIAAPRLVRLPLRIYVPMLLIFASGLLATQSRGSMLELVAGLLVWFVRTRKERGRAVTVLAGLIAAGFAYFVVTSVQSQFASQAAGQHINSITTRYQVEDRTRKLFYHHPLTGVGLRFYKTAKYSTYQVPNNIADEVLAEAGIPGLIGLVVLVTGSVVACRRIPGQYGTAALAVTIGHFVHGAVDIYWVAGTVTLPWLIVGMACGSVEEALPEGQRAPTPVLEAVPV